MKSGKRGRNVAFGASLLVLLAGALLTNAPAKADSTFVADAIAQAQEAPTAEGKWQVTATVVLTSESSGTMTASGPVSVVSAPDDALKGVLPMKIGDETGVSTLGVTVLPDGTVGLQWLIAGKPYLGRPALIFKASSFPNYLSKLINFGGAKRRMKLTLSTERVQETTNNGNPPRIRVPKKKEPIGKRYKIVGRLVVTDSSDGYGDNTVEITGVLLLTQRARKRADGQMPDRPLVTIIPQPLGKNASLPSDNNIFLDHIFANPKTEYLQVRTLIYDEDDVSSDDVMNVNESRLRTLASLAGTGEHTLPGDRDSENVEVYYTVTFVEDLY